MRFERLERVECRVYDARANRTRRVWGEIIGPDSKGNPGWRRVILDERVLGTCGFDRECDLRLYDLRKLSLLELIAEAAR